MKIWTVAIVGSMLAQSPVSNAQRSDMGDNSSGSTEYPNAEWQAVKIGEHFYQFPVVEQLITNFGVSAVEIAVPDSFWCLIKAQVDPQNWPAGVCTMGSEIQTLYFSRPDDLHQWQRNSKSELPPVRGPVEFWKEVENVQLWRSLDPKIHINGLLYATFKGRTDIYGQCNEAHLDWVHSCNIMWFDGSMIHNLSVPAKWLKNAPAAIDEYRRRIQLQPVATKVNEGQVL